MAYIPVAFILFIYYCSLTLSTYVVCLNQEDEESLEVGAGYKGRSGRWSESSDGSGSDPETRMRQINYGQYNFYEYKPRPTEEPQPYDDAEDQPAPLNQQQFQQFNIAPQYPSNYPPQYPQYPPLPQQQYPYPYPYPFPYYPVRPTTPPTTTTKKSSTPDPTKPIGYLLMNTYDTKQGSFSRPVAFFKTR